MIQLQQKIWSEIEPYRPYVKIAHHIPGRLRLRVSPGILKVLKQESKGWMESAAVRIQQVVDQVLHQMEGVHDVRYNKVAGTVIIQYDANHLSRDLWHQLFEGDQQGFFSAFQHIYHSCGGERVHAVLEQARDEIVNG